MNALLHEGLIGTHNISNAAIVRQKDGAVKARSPQFQISPTDIQRIRQCFENSKEARTAENAIVFMDVPYRAVRADALAIYAKNDKHGVIIAKTLQHYIIGMYDNNMLASVAAEAVEKLGT
ncbi:profilin [Cladochytrium replicatum]|nr:profilin [Cladochytrium replicatum]